VIVATASPGWAILADGFSYVISVVCLAALSLSPLVGTGTGSFYAHLRRGWSEFWSRTWLWAIVLVFSIFNMVMFAPWLVLGAVVAKQSLGGATAWGTVLACQGAGSVLGGIAMLRLRPNRPLVVAALSLLAWPFPLVSLAFLAPVPVIAVGSFTGGIAFAVFDTQWQTTMQSQVPSELLSRVSSYDWFGSLVFLPLGYALAGPVAAAVGTRAVFVFASGYVLVAAAAVLSIPSVRRMRAGTAAGPGGPT
jgi:hypothetical protein